MVALRSEKSVKTRKAARANTRVAILGGVRTPLVKAGANFKSMHVTELARIVMQEALYRTGVRADQLDEVILGNVCMPADATNPARVAALWAGVPDEVPAFTVQRNCASGMEAVAEAAQRIRAKRGERASDGSAPIILAGGAESMSTIPLLFPQSTLGPMAKMARAKTLFQRLGGARKAKRRLTAVRT